MRMPRLVSKKLQASDARHFVGNTMFDRCARATCAAGVNMPKKELLENWTLASMIQFSIKVTYCKSRVSCSVSLSTTNQKQNLKYAALKPSFELSPDLKHRRSRSVSTARTAFPFPSSQRLLLVRETC